MLNQLLRPDVISFIYEHRESDLDRLLLNKNKYPELPIPLVVDQLKAREKAKHKLPLWFSTKGVVMPPLISIEQCSSEETASYKAGLVGGALAIDLTGGAGVDTYYLSKKFEKVIYVEENRDIADIAQHNFKMFGVQNIEVRNLKSEIFLANLKQQADLIYIDPARRDRTNRVFKFESCSPNILLFQSKLFELSEKVLLKASPMLDISAGLKQLSNVQKVHVVAIKNEVKELLFIQNTTAPNDSIEVVCTNLGDEKTLSFPWGTTVGTIISDIKNYLYEPNAAILKSGGSNWLTHNFPVCKIHQHTHLFTSDQHIKDFPGKVFRVDEVAKYRKKEVVKYVTSNKANVAVRNFPDSVETFRKKTGLLPGGSQYLFGIRRYDSKVRVLICSKLK